MPHIIIRRVITHHMYLQQSLSLPYQSSMNTNEKNMSSQPLPLTPPLLPSSSPTPPPLPPPYPIGMTFTTYSLVVLLIISTAASSSQAIGPIQTRQARTPPAFASHTSSSALLFNGERSKFACMGSSQV